MKSETVLTWRSFHYEGVRTACLPESRRAVGAPVKDLLCPGWSVSSSFMQKSIHQIPHWPQMTWNFFALLYLLLEPRGQGPPSKDAVLPQRLAGSFWSLF